MDKNPSINTRFPELEVSGTPNEMGRQIGEHFQDKIIELSEIVLDRCNKGNSEPVTWLQAESVAVKTFRRAIELFPDIVSEMNGTSETSGVPVERLMVLNARNMLSASTEGCTSVIVDAQASSTGTGFAGQNWDNDPAMSPLSAVITRKGDGKPAFMSWMQPGLVAYMGINSEGLGICMNALNGPSDVTGVPWYFLVRAILESESVNAAIATVSSVPRSLTANAAMITKDGPLNLEITPDSVESLKADTDGILVHTNHCVHPALSKNNDQYSARIYGQSFERRDRGEKLLTERLSNGSIPVEFAKILLSDHDGYPTSICRHPNNDPFTGWQSSVVSIILEPGQNQIQVSNGNPCENAYETYKMA
ncbi:MAG: hypothetical protein CL731_10335 [Chloroflexi bacterium]|nr:hypothetical protein [Chloroflexota bacterium]|tara:strand:- start:2331 stop:3422 length:1092 start_codon:yes stop_codon:yes gene_type:complete